MRVKLMAGNWKMNKTTAELPAFFAELQQAFGTKPKDVAGRVEILFAAPYTSLQKAAELARPLGIRIAAQNIHWQEAGAFTGEVSIAMLKDVGIGATLIGHSERRQYFAETDAAVAEKTKAALAKGVMPITCVGETLAEREAGQTESVVRRQLQAVLEAIPAPGDLVIAYEPVWAIGTGRSATTAQAQDVHAFIRGVVADRFGAASAEKLRILYGGSANPANIGDLLAQPDIDGGLVGGASLKAADFAKMLQSAL
jgi:triosephosphate isomerase